MSKTCAESKPFFFFSSFAFLPLSAFLTCSRHRARAREYILGGRSELEGAERKRAILALRAGGVVDGDEDEKDDELAGELVDRDECEGTPLLAPAAPTCARTHGRREVETRGLLCGAPFELKWPAIVMGERAGLIRN